MSEIFGVKVERMAVSAEPGNALNTLKHHGEMVDLIWHYAGDKSTDFNWYSKRILLSGVVNSTQLHMLQDKSEDYRDTWTFLEERLSNVASIGMSMNKLRSDVTNLTTFAEAAVETGRNVIGFPNTNR